MLTSGYTIFPSMKKFILAVIYILIATFAALYVTINDTYYKYGYSPAQKIELKQKLQTAIETQCTTKRYECQEAEAVLATLGSTYGYYDKARESIDKLGWSIGYFPKNSLELSDYLSLFGTFIISLFLFTLPIIIYMNRSYIARNFRYKKK